MSEAVGEWVIFGCAAFGRSSVDSIINVGISLTWTWNLDGKMELCIGVSHLSPFCTVGIELLSSQSKSLQDNLLQ